jgi:hypothetical protein
MTHPERDPRFTDPAPPGYGEPVHQEEVVERTPARVRVVRVVCGLIDLVCAVFAIVLAIHIVLVLGSANASNAFAQFVGDFATSVSLGLRGLFTTGTPKIDTLLDEGLAAILWLIIGAVLTGVITRAALPAGSSRRVWYRRTVR